VIEDPRQFIEYIPFTELEAVNSDQERNMYVWNPGRSIPRFEHHLVVEEVILQFCVQNNYLFPGYLHEGKVAFFARPMGEIEFVKEIQWFWQKWVRTTSATW